MKHAIIIAAIIACTTAAHAEPKLELRLEGTVAAGAVSTNLIAAATTSVPAGTQRGWIGNIMLTYAAAATNVVSVQLVHANTNTFQPYSVTFASSKHVAGSTAGTVPVLTGEKLLIDNSASAATLTYSIDLMKGAK